MTNQLEILSKAKTAVASAHSVFEVTKLVKLAEAVMAVTDAEAIREQAMELYLRARRRRGEIVKALPKSKGGNPNLPTGPRIRPVETLASQGIDKREASQDYRLMEIPSEKFEAFIQEPDKNFAQAMRVAKDVGRDEKRDERKQATGKATEFIGKAKLEDVFELRECSFADLLSDCKADVIITDPPYPREFIPLYGQFAKAAKESGIPIVAVMCGQTYFPTILSDMCKHLEYRWLMCYLTPGGTLQQWSVNAMCGWKPVVLFGGEKWVYDVFKSDKDDKRFHGWGQSLSGLCDLVDRLSEPGQTVCDPFCGGGSTAMAALSLGRKFVGCDIDKEAVATTTERIKAAIHG